MKDLEVSDCKLCVNSKITKDEKWKIKITCKYSPTVCFLGGFLPCRMNENCEHFKKKQFI